MMLKGLSRKIKNSLISEDEIRVRDLLQRVRVMKEAYKASTMRFSEKVPEEAFKFICFRESALFFYGIYEIVDSEFYLVIKGEEELRLYHNKYFKPLEDKESFDRFLLYKGEKLEEVLHKIPKKAGGFLCFHMDIINA